jgi:hypothetical protein
MEDACRRRTAVPSATVRRNDELAAGGVYFSVCYDIGTVGIASEVATLSRSRRVWRLFFRNAAECGCVRRLLVTPKVGGPARAHAS